ncbi:MAG: hypothetical protein UDG84_00455 [Thomasclavelia sp.]|nr:hypothetical protein [Thomasclavelia sp.]
MPEFPLDLPSKLVALHHNVGALISKEIYIKHKNVQTKGGELYAYCNS